MNQIRRIDVLVLGGGYGTRLFRNHKRKYIPKGLIKIAGKASIDRALEAFQSKLIDRVIIETNNEGKTHYSKWAKSYKGTGRLEIFIEPVSKPNNCLGVLDTILYTYNHYKFKKPVLIIAPDNIFTEPQTHLLENLNDSHITLLSYEVPSTSEARRYGVLEVLGEKVTECQEKPESPNSKLIRTACEIWPPEIFRKLKNWINLRDSDKMGAFISYLIKEKIQVRHIEVKGKWLDIGSQKSLKGAQTLWE